MRKGYKHLTEAKKAEICRLHGEDMSEKEIAGVVDCHRNSVYRTLREAGLSLPYRGARSPMLTKAQQNKVLRLLRLGLGTVPAAARLGLRPHAVRMFAEKSGFRRQPGEYGYRLRLSETEKEKILQEIRLRANHATDIAAKFPDVPYRSIIEMAHKELNCPKFRSGRSVVPLSSDFPSKHFRGELHNG